MFYTVDEEDEKKNARKTNKQQKIMNQKSTANIDEEKQT